MSAVSAVDADGNNDTIDSSADAEALAIENDVNAIDDLGENVADGGDEALAIENDVNAMDELNEDDTGSDDVLQSDAKSAAAGEKEILSVEDSDSDVLGAKGSRIHIDDAYSQKIGSDYKIIVTGYVRDVDDEDINKGTVSIYLNDELKGYCDAEFGEFSGEVDVGPGNYNVRVRYHDDSGDYDDSQNDYYDNPIIIKPPEPVTWYVNGSKPYGGGGKSEADAFSTLNEALYAASNNDTVKIAAGTYAGGANIGVYIQKILTFEKYGDGEAIFDGQGQDTIWSVGVDTINIYGLTFINGGGPYGGAIYFLTDLSNSVINATFRDNSVTIYGGAIYVGNSVSNLTLRSTFINNTANEYGAAVYIKSTASNLILNSTFIGNTAGNKGAAVYIGEAADNVKVYGEYINNTAKNLGGAFCFNGALTGVDISGEFINNNGGDSIIYIGNSVSGNSIHDSVFLNNEAYKIFSVNDGEITTAKDNWFGNDATNYYKIPEDVGIDLENWLFLNATADPSELEADEKSAIIFKLSSFGGSEIIDYDASKMNIVLDLSQTLGQLDKTSAPIGENITYTAKESGNATVTGKFETASYTVRLTNSDPRTPTSINVTNSTLDLKAKDVVAAGATLTPADAGNLTYTSSNPSVVKVENGKIIALAEGNATITVSFAGNEWYSPVGNKTIDVTVRALDANWTYINIYTGNESDLDRALLYLPWNYVPTCYVRDANGTGLPAGTNVTIFCEGNENYTLNAVVQDNGLFSVNVSDIVPGKYSVIFAAGKAYKTATATIVVMKVDTNITVDNETVSLIAGDEVGSGATLTPADAGNLTYTSSNPSVVKVENGTIKAISAGNATITVSFAGNDKYFAAENKTINVTVGLKNVIINVQNSTVKLIFGDSFTINATTVPEGLNLTYVVDDSGVISVDENGTVTTLKLGSASILVKFDGDDVYAANSTVVYIDVSVNRVEIPPEVAFNFTSDGNGTEMILVNLPEGATGFVLLDINGTQTHVELVNGKANMTIPKLAEGTYNATVTYAGDDWYAPVSATNEINVTSNVPESALSIPESSESDVSTTYSISLPSDAGGYLEVDVDGKQYSAPLNNGSATISVPIDSGSHNVTVKYGGDKNYSPITKEVTLNVTNPIVNITENKDVVAAYSANATYKVLIIRDGQAVVGEAVAFKYNGASYTVKTDSQGYATLKLKTKLKVNKYTVTATYRGVKVTNTVTIKSILVAQNKKVKKSSKVTKINISLKKVNGNYFKGVTVKIIFNGKAYKVKTNNKGVAVWKVKKSMLTKHKVGKKYNYKVVYGKDTVTKKLTIRK